MSFLLNVLPAANSRTDAFASHISLRKLRKNPSKGFWAINAKVRFAAPCSLLGTVSSSSIRPLGFEDEDEHEDDWVHGPDARS